MCRDKEKKVKALMLFSGGLDSILAVKVLEQQNIDLVGLVFVSYFFDAKKAQEMAKLLKIPLKIIDFSDEHLSIVKNPKHGYGKYMNPCLDCRILMLKKAKEVMDKEGFDFIATGEVLGERPMTQTRQALDLVAQSSGLSGYLLRPLSAQLLAETFPEKNGLIKRKKLLSLKGKARKKQIALAQKWHIKNYPTPAGGCLLTDPQFSQRLRDLFSHSPDCSGKDIIFLKLGRHFWFEKTKIIVGRNQEENNQLIKLAGKDDVLMEIDNYSGPTILIRGPLNKKVFKKAVDLIVRYSSQARQANKIIIRYWGREKGEFQVIV